MSGNTPINHVYVPNVGPVQLQGGAQTTDNNGQLSAPAQIQLGAGTALVGSVNLQDPSVPSQKAHIDASGSVVTEDVIRYYTLAGKAFTLSLDVQTSSTTTNYWGIGIFNNSTAKNVLLYRAAGLYNAASSHRTVARLVTADPAFGTAPTNLVTNDSNNGATSAIVANISYSAAEVTLPALSSSSVAAGIAAGGSNNMSELLVNGKVWLLPAGAANGVAFYVYNSSTTAGQWSFVAQWIEY